MSAGLIGKETTRLRSLLNKWQAEFEDQQKLVYLLQHKYTQSSLSLNNLKGRDKAVCQSLYDVGLECKFTIFLARMTRTAFEEEDEILADELDETVLEHIKTCNGFTISNRAGVREKEILGEAIWDRPADSEYEGEFTGNASMPAMFRYHDTVVIIVPTRKIASLFSTADPHALMGLMSHTLRDRPDDHYTYDTLLPILDEALLKSWTILDGRFLCNIIDVALNSRKMGLYRAALRASLKASSSRELVFPTVAQYMSEAFRQDSTTSPDWDYWLGDMATAIHQLRLATSAEILPQLDLLVLDDALKGFVPRLEEDNVKDSRDIEAELRNERL
ncbi:hypothetical protein GGR52DRAFT_573621 [Hypoxylon sp. FL1284]|nr:hypothetical protein GGR52DRAFT_573621 [Hypoxylon sp. FL1284]